MRILYKTMGFNGGASRSLLEYVKTAKKYGHEVIVLGDSSKVYPEYYIENEIRILQIKYLKINSIIMQIPKIIDYYKAIKKEHVDIIQSITNYENILTKILSELTGVPIIYTIPGGMIDEITQKVYKKFFRNEKFIVFSQENYHELMKLNILDENIHLISNRIRINDQLNVQCTKTDCIYSALITRIAKDKINSVVSTINVINQLNKEGIKIKIDIIGNVNTDCKDNFFELINATNSEYDSPIINYLGYINNIIDKYDEYHVFFGKGRSVIEPLLYNKKAIVVNENNGFYICDENNLASIYKTNFSGRNISNSNDFAYIKEFISNCIYDEGNSLYVQNFINDRYNIANKEEYILELYNNLCCNTKSKNFYKAALILLYTQLWSIILKIKMKLKMSKKKRW